MRSALLAMTLLTAGLAGCLDFLEFQGGINSVCPSLEISHRQAPFQDSRGLQTDPNQPWDALVLLRGDLTSDRLYAQPPSGWTWQFHNVSQGDASALRMLRLTPRDSPTGGDLAVDVSAFNNAVPNCSASYHARITQTLRDPAPGQVAAVGKGVHVHTAGFWENGTLFYTNLDWVNNSDWPRAGWYEYGGGDALPVYVYDESRGERPLLWNATLRPKADLTLWEYHTTIEGFNEALKGLSTNTARVVHIPPEEAYTVAGKEHHLLYGSSLVFYIQVDEVVDLPCPAPLPTLACDVPLL